MNIADKKINLSHCCMSPTGFCPPSFGESGFMICIKCNKNCTYKEYPVYELVSKGVYRKIKYDENKR